MFFLELIIHANIFVKLIVILLFILSIISWSIILNQYLLQKKLLTEIFLLMETKKIKENLKTALNIFIKNKKDSEIENIFSKGLSIKDNNLSKKYNEFNINKKTAKLESEIKMLATISSVSPYIGLLGTVIGIMVSFIAIREMNGVDLEYIAPGIAEALVVTAIGLFVAIPSNIFFNKLLNRISLIETSYNEIKEEVYLNREELGIQNEN